MLVPRRGLEERLQGFVDRPLIKVLTGIRRSGKSSLMTLTAEGLLAAEKPPDSILRLDMDSARLTDLADARSLLAYIDANLPRKGGRGYLFLDEIQEVSGWEKVVNTLFQEGDTDVFLTGSNSRLLASELATYVAGRYVSFEVSTLSLAEFIDFRRRLFGDLSTTDQHFARYLRQGGFPGIVAANLEDGQADTAIQDIFNSALIRDVVSRHHIRNTDLLERVARFALASTGSPFSGRSVARFLKSERRSTDPETVLGYLRRLSEAFLLNRVPQFDIQGKRELAVAEKFFPGDHSLLWALLGFDDRFLPGVLESIVWAELRRRGFAVFVGKTSGLEVDFVARRPDTQVYVQVTTAFGTSAEQRDRELASLKRIKDSHPKFVVSLDAHAGSNIDGIKVRSLPDFLLGDEF